MKLPLVRRTRLEAAEAHRAELQNQVIALRQDGLLLRDLLAELRRCLPLLRPTVVLKPEPTFLPGDEAGMIVMLSMEQVIIGRIATHRTDPLPPDGGQVRFMASELVRRMGPDLTAEIERSLRKSFGLPGARKESPNP